MSSSSPIGGNRVGPSYTGEVGRPSSASPKVTVDNEHVSGKMDKEARKADLKQGAIKVQIGSLNFLITASRLEKIPEGERRDFAVKLAKEAYAKRIDSSSQKLEKSEAPKTPKQVFTAAFKAPNISGSIKTMFSALQKVFEKFTSTTPQQKFLNNLKKFDDAKINHNTKATLLKNMMADDYARTILIKTAEKYDIGAEFKFMVAYKDMESEKDPAIKQIKMTAIKNEYLTDGAPSFVNMTGTSRGARKAVLSSDSDESKIDTSMKTLYDNIAIQNVTNLLVQKDRHPEIKNNAKEFDKDPTSLGEIKLYSEANNPDGLIAKLRSASTNKPEVSENANKVPSNKSEVSENANKVPSNKPEVSENTNEATLVKPGKPKPVVDLNKDYAPEDTDF